MERPTVRLDPASSHGRLYFAGEGGPPADRREYELEVELYGEIDAEASRVAVGARSVSVVVAKKESGPHWPRLLAAKGRVPMWLKIDWDRWKDEDEEEEEENADTFDLGDLDELKLYDDPRDKDIHTDSDDEGAQPEAHGDAGLIMLRCARVSQCSRVAHSRSLACVSACR